MSLKNSYKLSGFLAGIYIIFSAFYLLFLLFSPMVLHMPILFLFILTLPSLFIFLISIEKDRENFYRNFLILIALIYLMELPSFAPGVDPLWRALLLVVDSTGTILFSFIVIILAIPYAIKKSVPPQRKTLSKILHPSVNEEDRIAFGIAMFFFLIGCIPYLFSFYAPYSKPFLREVVGGLQIIFYTCFVFLLVKAYLHDGLAYGILLISGFVSTLVYFKFSYIYKTPFVGTLWVLPFALTGLFYIASELFSRARSKKHSPIQNI